MLVKSPDACNSFVPYPRAIFHASADVVKSLVNLVDIQNGFYALHDLRLDRFGQEAWIDHLLIHRYGFTLIESRTLAVSTYRDGEGRWFQLFDEGSQEVYSPVARLKQNALVLKALLFDHQEHLLRQGTLFDVVGKLEVDLFVSIAEASELTSEGVGFSSLVVYARQLGGLMNDKHIERYMQERQGWGQRLSPTRAYLTREDLKAVSKFLLRSHQPLGTGTKYETAHLAHYFKAA